MTTYQAADRAAATGRRESIIKSLLFTGRLKRLGGELLWIAGGQAAAAAGAVLSVLALTRVLPPKIYGEVALAMTLVALAQQVAVGPLAAAYLRFYPASVGSGQTRSYLRAVKETLSGVSKILLVVWAVSGLALYIVGGGRWVGLFFASWCFALLSGYSGALDGIQNAARERVVVACHQGAGQWLRLAMALIAIQWLGSSSFSVMLGFAVAAFAVFASQLVWFRKRITEPAMTMGPPTIALTAIWRASMIKYTWPFVSWSVFGWALASSDRWALQIFATTADVGRFNALFQLGYQPIVLISGFVVQLVSPIFFARAGDGSDKLRLAETERLNRRLVLTTCILTFAAAVVTTFCHRAIFSAFTAPAYRNASGLLPFITVSAGLFSAGQMAVLSILSGLSSRTLIWPKIVCALVGVCLNLISAYYAGLKGVVWSGVFTSGLYLGWVFWLASRPRKILIART